MQATLDAPALKQLVRALTCLSRYGDDLMIIASLNRLLLHTTNTSQTAYGRIVYNSRFFVRYRVDPRSMDEDMNVDGQLSIKSLLGVLKPKTVEKTVTKCDLSIVHGEAPEGEEDEDHDSLESKLIVRLYCKHGVVKTHRLLLAETLKHMAPNVPDSVEESNLSIPPKNLKDIIEHFNTAKVGKVDPQLIWTFDTDSVLVRSQESFNSKGTSQIATEFSVGADEFTTYDIFAPPVTIAFHLREFSAMMAFAEACGLSVHMQFTVPGNPLFVQPEGGEFYETLFIISLTQVITSGNTSQASNNRSAPQRQPQPQPQRRKRPLEDDSNQSSASVNENGDSQAHRQPERIPIRPKQPMKAIVRTNRAESSARDMESPAPGGSRGSMPPPSLPASAMKRGPTASQRTDPDPPPSEQPLFLPSSQLSQLSQLSREAEEAIIQSGLGIENMDMAEFAAMLEDEGEEVGFNVDEDGEGGAQGEDVQMRESSLEIWETGTQLGPTQESRSDRVFKPLFDD
ncbi:unnamed protein product [Somion occarium]|uniref:Uncharacterized protein n=1 Tax=Somion occarium TaxID=3059160 RepID=A0ABP1E3H5_9APHY